MSLFSNIRFWVLVLSFMLSVGEYVFLREQLGVIVPTFGYTSVFFLYLALLIGPLTKVIHNIPFAPKLVKARRAIGVSAFYFALLHFRLSFFEFIGGFTGLSFLDTRYVIAISLSSIAMLILTFMAITSFDYVIKIMTFTKWKMLHRFVYVASLFILIHVVLIGTQFHASLFIQAALGIGTIFLVGLHVVGLIRKYKIKKV